MTTKKQLEQENEQLWQKINQLRDNITKLEDEIETLKKENKTQRWTINELETMIFLLNGSVWDARY